MAGHSKWANIKRRKGAQDAARGKLFTKLIKEIKNTPDPNAKTIVPPRVISNIRLCPRVGGSMTQTFAKTKMYNV